jgi:hypothetical protein
MRCDLSVKLDHFEVLGHHHSIGQRPGPIPVTTGGKTSSHYWTHTVVDRSGNVDIRYRPNGRSGTESSDDTQHCKTRALSYHV